MRVALVRGSSLNPWELSNFELLDQDVTAFAARSTIQAITGGRIPVRRLASPADALRRLPGLAQGGVLRFSGSVEYLAGLEGALRGFDVAHVAELANPYSLQAVRARRRGNTGRVVATVWENIALPPTPNNATRRRMRAVADGADAFVAITDDARLHLELAGVPPDRIELFPMGIDLDRFTPAGGERRDGPLRVVSVTRLVSEKGVEDLAVALRLLGDRGVDAQVTLVGTGPLEGRLRSMADELGVTDRLGSRARCIDRVPALLADSDVFVLASAPRATWREQFGFAVVEAMAAGLPVLAGDSGSLGEVIGDPGRARQAARSRARSRPLSRSSPATTSCAGRAARPTALAPRSATTGGLLPAGSASCTSACCPSRRVLDRRRGHALRQHGADVPEPRPPARQAQDNGQRDAQEGRHGRGERAGGHQLRARNGDRQQGRQVQKGDPVARARPEEPRRREQHHDHLGDPGHACRGGGAVVEREGQA